MASALRRAPVLALAVLAARAPAQSLFDFPRPARSFGHGWGGFDPFFEPERAALAPCPRYDPMRVQDAWREGSDGRFTLQAALPGVRPQDRRVFLSRDGSRLHVQAWRPLPARGRLCLPEGASVSADGRREVLDVAVRLPASADAAAVTLRLVRDGLEIAAPRSSTPPATAPAPAAAAAGAAGATARRTAATPPRRPPVRERPALPYPSDGVEVVDGHEDGEEEEAPEKNPDAAEGWWDNRGEFHHY